MNKNRNHQRNKSGQTYVWRVSWYNYNVRGGSRQYRAFSSKRDALIFECKLKSNYNNCGIYIEKYNGDY